MEEEDLIRLAADELLKEAERGVARANVAGPMAWLPGAVPSTDKRFLANTLRHTLAANRVRGRRARAADAPPRARSRQAEGRPDTADGSSDVVRRQTATPTGGRRGAADRADSGAAKRRRVGQQSDRRPGSAQVRPSGGSKPGQVRPSGGSKPGQDCAESEEDSGRQGLDRTQRCDKRRARTVQI